MRKRSNTLHFTTVILALLISAIPEYKIQACGRTTSIMTVSRASQTSSTSRCPKFGEIINAKDTLSLLKDKNNTTGVSRKKKRHNRKNKQRKTFRQIIEESDSLRLQMREAAEKGYMLQWADTLYRKIFGKTNNDSIKLRQYSKKLQKVDNKLKFIDNILAKKYNKIKYDTMYISRPPYRWTIKLRGSLSGATLQTLTNNDNINEDTRLHSACRGTMSVGATYRGLGLSLSINPGKLAGINKDYELNLNSYGNKFGFDIVFLSSNTLKGYQEINGTRTDVDKGTVSQDALNINLYYAFNGRRFSYPAAFTQSYIQKRSAGSFMIGASFDGTKTRVNDNTSKGTIPSKLTLVEFAVGAGYGYNLVLGKRWLFHLSALPTFTVFAHSKMEETGEVQRMRYKFPSIIITERGAIVYTWRNKFWGLSTVYNFSLHGDERYLQIRRNKWMLRTTFGFRF